MDKVHKITGLGPVQADGSVDVFTIRSTPFHVEKAWLDQYAALPAVGQDLVEREDGTLELGVEDAPGAAAASADDTQKKTDGLDVSGSQSAPSIIVTSGVEAPAPDVIPPAPQAIVWKEYVAQPFVVRAAVVTNIANTGTDETTGTALLDNGASIQFTAATVNVGDYWLSHDTAPNANGGFLSANDFNQMFEIDPEQTEA